MSNPKFIPTQKKVTYSFRVEEEKLEKLKQMSKLNDIKLPQLMSDILGTYLSNKVVFNTYLEDLEGMFIDLPDITQGRSYDEFTNDDYWLSNLTFDYEIQSIPNNLDVWDSKLKTYKSPSGNYLHEGIEFLIVPELSQYERDNYSDLNQYLYCIYFTVGKKSKVEIEYIPFLTAINKIKKSENYPLLDYALKIKETIEEKTFYIEEQKILLSEEHIFPEFEYVEKALKLLSKEFNTGNIIPINESRKEIEYKASFQSMSDVEKENILKENEEMKKKLKQLDSISKKLKELEESQKGLESKVLGDIDEEKLENLKEHL